MADTDGNDPKLHAGDIRFFDNCVPALEVGDYLINLVQEVKPHTTPAIDECYATSQVFSVQGPRYALPAGDLFSTFPPDNGVGVFDQFLPHAVLTKRDLPWERDVFGDGEDHARRTPWMALLLFVAGEQFDGVDALLAPRVDGWKQNRTMTATIKASDFFRHGAGGGILWPALGEPEWYETDEFLDSTPCTIIDVSRQAFNALVPGREDLRYLAHVRQVDPSAKDASVLKVTGDGWYSVVVGRRLPDESPAGKAGKRNVVHLVSLEGFKDHINDAGGSVPASYERVRMISLKSWTFTCLAEQGGSFSHLMNGLIKDPQGGEKPTALVLPARPPASTLETAGYTHTVIQNGYVPLRYQTRLGEETFAWYRGPFSPVPVKNFVGPLQQAHGAQDPAGWRPFGTASSAIVYDKEYGIFDVSYGVAWETGRLLALSDAHFGQELLDWQRKGHALLDLIIERKGQIAALKSLDPGDPDPRTEKSLLDLIQPYVITQGFVHYLVDRFAKQIAPKPLSPAPEPPVPPVPPTPKPPAPTHDPQTIADLLKEPDVQQAVRQVGGQELGAIVDWLARLYLLLGVPFENLIPHADLLPPESIRFFYVDSNWLDTLVEGALSIGIESSRDRLYQDLMKDLIWNTLQSAAQQVRDGLLGDQAHATPPGSDVPFDKESLTGMLLRSSVVAGWPGLTTDAYTRTMPGSTEPDLDSRVQLLRMERLSSDTLLCLWPAVPAVVTVEEPHEGVAFGFEDPPEKSGEGKGKGCYLYLRSLDPSGARYGKPMCTGEQMEDGSCKFMIDAQKSGIIDGKRIVKIGGSDGLLKTIKGLLPGHPDISVRDLAVELIKVPEQAVFASRSLKKEEGS